MACRLQKWLLSLSELLPFDYFFTDYPYAHLNSVYHMEYLNETS